MIAIILGQGSGTRLRPLTENLPKNLIPVLGKPVIEWQMDLLARSGVDTVHVMTSGYGEAWKKWYDSFRGQVDVIIHSSDPRGSAGCLTLMDELPPSFYVLNGDVITDIPVDQLSTCQPGLHSCIALIPLPSPFGVVDVDEEIVTGFREKPVLKEYLINAGIYYMRKEIAEYIQPGFMFETDVFPKLAKSRKLGYRKFDGVFWKNIETVKDIREAEEFLSSRLWGRHV